MKIRVKLFGVLPQKPPDYDPASGLILDVPDDARVFNILEMLNIPSQFSGVVSIGGRVAKLEDRLSPDAEVHILQAMHGG